MGIEIVYHCSSAISVYFSVYEEWIFALIVLGRIYLFYYHIMPVHEGLEFVSIKKLIVYLLIKYVLRRWAGTASLSICYSTNSRLCTHTHMLSHQQKTKKNNVTVLKKDPQHFKL